MKIVVPKLGEFEVKDINYKEARKLHLKNVKTFWGKEDGEGLDPDIYYALLEECRVLSGIKESELEKYSMVQVDSILQQILMEYTGLNPKD